MTDLSELLMQGQQPQGESRHLEVLKDLSDELKQKILSELNEDEIRIFTRLNALSELLKKIYKTDVLPVSSILDHFIILRVNKDRKRAKEIVEAFNSDRVGRSENAVFRRLGGMSGGGMLR